MIRNESEYQEAVGRLRDESARLEQHRSGLAEHGLTNEEINRAMEPLLSFHEQLKEEVESYERLKRGEFGAFENFRGIGRLLIAARIYRGMSQRELADRLEVHESTVSRDERNEYHGITMERATRVLDALGLLVRTQVVSAPHEPDPTRQRTPLTVA